LIGTQSIPRRQPGQREAARQTVSQTIDNLIGPEPLEPAQRLVEGNELIGIDATDLLHRTQVLVIERIDDVAHLATFIGELDANGEALFPRSMSLRYAAGSKIALNNSINIRLSATVNDRGMDNCGIAISVHPCCRRDVEPSVAQFGDNAED
jgi:hypothetical protein